MFGVTRHAIRSSFSTTTPFLRSQMGNIASALLSPVYPPPPVPSLSSSLSAPSFSPVPSLTPVQSLAQELTLPPEVWINIHRFVVSGILPLPQVFPTVEGSAAPEDPLNELQLQRLLDAARSLAGVCKLWNSLAQELLYENIWVRDNERWPSLHNALQRIQNARRVRGVRLSSTRPDHNVWVLQRCPHIHVLVLPEAQGSDGDGDTGVAPNPLPTLPLLKHLYWAETLSGAALLPAVLTAAPNIEQISLARKVKTPRFNAQRIDRSAAFPPLPCVRSLSLRRVRETCLQKFWTTTLPQLTHLTICRASLHENISRPLFPTLRVLALVTNPAERVSFPAILRHFPALCELRYDASNPPLIQSSGPLAAKLVCVRLHLPLPAPAPTPDLREDVARRNPEPLLHLAIAQRYRWAPLEDLTPTCAGAQERGAAYAPDIPRAAARRLGRARVGRVCEWDGVGRAMREGVSGRGWSAVSDGCQSKATSLVSNSRARTD
ncbi:hypothetical protein DFH06DRAFT_140092 [Mycena polygramma]|nr:hypothetical protein DFH06DRAFT_140092 [Mycena polygramma]